MLSAVERGSAATGSGGKWVLIVFLLTIFEGAIRKWLVPDSPTFRYSVYFSKDVAFVCAALAGLAHAQSKLKLVGALWVVSFIALLVPTIVNIGNTPGVGALLSVRAYLIVPMCAFLGAYTLRSLRDVDWIVSAVGVSTIAVAILGAVQFDLPQNHFLNSYEGSGEGVHIIAEYGHVRATGTFAFITGMAMMTGVGAWAGLYLFLSGGLRKRLLGLAVLVAGLICSLTSMSRGGIVLYAMTIAGGIILFRRLKESALLIMVGLIGFWLFGGGSSADESVDPGLQGAVVQRFQGADSPVDRLSYILMNLQLGLTGDPLGRGLGRGQVGGNFAETGGRSWGGGYESELGRIAFEVGILGWFGVVLWRITAVVQMGKLLLRAEDIRVRALLAASLPLFTMLAMNYMAFNHTGSSFAWAIFALALGAATLDRQRLATRDADTRIPAFKFS
jgi:hypothetical protein